MTISTEVRKAGPFIGNGSASSFPFAFKVFKAADLIVVRRQDNIGVETTLVLDSDYHVTLNVNQDTTPGGVVALTGGALADGFTLIVSSELPYLQPTDLTNQGGFYPRVITNALDRLTIFCQQLAEITGRTLKLPITAPTNISAEIPLPNPSELIAWNETGTGLTTVSPQSLVTSIAYGSATADLFAGDGATTTFPLSTNPASVNNLDVSIGGHSQRPVQGGVGDYSWNGGASITFVVPPPAPTVPGDKNVLVRYMQAVPVSDSEALHAQTREALRRSYAEAGFNLVEGSFETGGTLASTTDVLLLESTGAAYAWEGAYPGGGYDVAPGIDPVVVPGFELRKNVGLRDIVAHSGTVADLAASKFKIGDIVELSDRAFGKFEVVSGGSANGLDILNAGGGNTAQYVYGICDTSPSHFGANSDGLDHSTAVQTAIDAPYPVKFTSDYTAAHVKLRGENKSIDFNGFSIIAPNGPKVTAEEYLVDITFRGSTAYNVRANAAFKDYQGAIRWHSLSVSNPSNNNKIYGITMIYSQNGLVYGNRPGEPVVDAPHSENTVYGVTCRGVRVPFVGNQPNGFLTIVSPILDCNPYEWAGEIGFDQNFWNLNSYCFVNHPSNSLEIIGGELLKTFTTVGVGYTGGNFSLTNVTNETAGTRCKFTGNAKIINESGGYMAGDSVPLYTCEDGSSGEVTITGGQCYRADGVASYSGIDMITNNAANSFRFTIENSNYVEWKPARRGTLNSSYCNTKFSGNSFQTEFFGSLDANTITPTLLNGWVASRTVKITKSLYGEITFTGYVSGGTVGTPIFNIGSLAPASQKTFYGLGMTGGTEGGIGINVNADGNVYIVAPATAGSLDCVRFRN